MRRIFIIGTDHRFQFGGGARTAAQNIAFGALLEELCGTNAVRCIAEEMSLDALRLQGKEESTVAAFAQQRGLRHIYCDPPESVQTHMGLHIERNANAYREWHQWPEERIAAGIASEHRMRERYWKERILEVNTWPCLLICGSEHALPVCTLLVEAGFPATVVHERWDA